MDRARDVLSLRLVSQQKLVIPVIRLYVAQTTSGNIALMKDLADETVADFLNQVASGSDLCGTQYPLGCGDCVVYCDCDTTNSTG